VNIARIQRAVCGIRTEINLRKLKVKTKNASQKLEQEHEKTRTEKGGLPLFLV
jgi:hypothetical protein